MLKVVSRKEALGMIDSIFTSFHFGLMSITDSGIENSWEREYFWTEANKVDQGRLTKEYEQTVSSLDAQGFNAYYKFIGEFAARYKIGCWEEYNQYEPIVIEELNDELGKHAKTEEKLELIDSFTVDELKSDSFIFDSKVQVLYDILDDSRVKDNKEKCINKVLSCFNSNDKAGFISKIQSDRHLLDALVDKVNGTEKDEMLALLGEMFISSGFIKDQKAVLLNNNKTDTVTATFKKGNINIDVKSPISGGAIDYATTKSKSITASPFDLIGLNYDGREIKVPALLLLNSWSNSAATPEGIFFNYKDEDIDWSKLSDEEKDKYFFDYVKHYLPSGFIEAFGNPIQIVIMACISILTGGLFAELQVALAAAGIVMSIADAKNAIGGIIQANNQKEAARTMHDAKKAAKVMAQSIAKLTLDAIDVICTVAGYLKGKKKIVNKETNQVLLKKSSVSKDDLIKYLESIDNYNAKNKGITTNYAFEYKNKGKWPNDVQIPRQKEFLNADGTIKYKELAPDDGYVEMTKLTLRDGIELPKKGSLIDRYGSTDGRYTSPIVDGKPYTYEQRSLPFVEDSRQYHVYEVQYDSILEAINNISDARLRNIYLKRYGKSNFHFRKGKIAPAFNQTGGGIQYEYEFKISDLLKMKYLREVTK